MRPHYVQVKDDIYIRLDDTETILIVKRFGITTPDKVILTFIGLVISERLSPEGRALFEEAFLKEFPTITPEEIDDAIIIMEDIMEEIAKNTVITGAPRLGKTTVALKAAMMNKDVDKTIYIARTIKSCQATIETAQKHVLSLKDIPITPIVSNVYGCKIAEDISKNAGGYNAVTMHCASCPYQYNEPKIVATPLHLTLDGIITICEKEHLCPSKFIKNRIEHFEAIGSKQLILITYARLKYDISNYNLTGNHQVISDEFRHIKNICIMKQISLNDHPTKIPHKKIIENYVEDIKKIDFSMLSPEAKEIIEDARNVWCENILKCKEFTAEFKVRKVFEEFIILINEPAPISLDGKPLPKPSYKTYATQIDFINLLSAADGNNVGLDDELRNADDENSVGLGIRKMDDENIESRKYFKKLTSTAKHVYFVDSTPPHKDYFGFWLGEDFEYKEITIPLKYEFYIPIENVRRSLKHTYKYPENTKYFTDVIKGVCKALKIDIFSASKKETLNLNDWGIDCKHMRGSEVEGVQSDKDYTITTRFPLQNFNSEKYREAAMLKMTNGKLTHDKYIKSTASQELVQAAFRTAQKGKTSGSFWMSMDETDIPTMRECWDWLNDKMITFIPLQKRKYSPDDKIGLVVKALLTGKLPKLTASEEAKAKKMLDFFKAHPDGTVRECFDFVGGDNTKNHWVLKYLEDECGLKIKKLSKEDMEKLREKGEAERIEELKKREAERIEELKRKEELKRWREEKLDEKEELKRKEGLAWIKKWDEMDKTIRLCEEEYMKTKTAQKLFQNAYLMGIDIIYYKKVNMSRNEFIDAYLKDTIHLEVSI